MVAEKDVILVTCATGKAGFECCKALVDDGFDVYGCTRNAAGGKKLAAINVKPVVCNYTCEIPKALAESGAKRLLFITDFFRAAKNKAEVEFEHGKHAVDAAKAAGVVHTIFISVNDADKWPAECDHLLAKPRVEAYLKASGIRYSLLGPVAFFENFDDPANFNPLTKGKLYFLDEGTVPFCATYDIGRAAAVQFKSPERWLGKKLDVCGQLADLQTCAAALEKVGGFPVKSGLAMPIWARRLFLRDLHYMCLHYMSPGVSASPSEFRKHVPGAMDAEAWFRHHNRYANGEPIVGNTTPPSKGNMSATIGIALAVAVASSLVYYVNRH